MSKMRELLVELAHFTQRRYGWHSLECNIHDKWETYCGVGSMGDEPPLRIPGGKCNCGATELVDRINDILDETRPGQLELDLKI